MNEGETNQDELEQELNQDQVDKEVNSEEAEASAESNQETDEKSEEPTWQTRYEEMNDKFLRLYSEFENFRRRTAKEKVAIMGNAKAESLKSMVPVVDDFDRAIANNEQVEEAQALKDGFGLIHHKLMGILQQNGLQPMATEAGDDFDTDKHEAITQIPAPSPELKGKVVDIVEKGYVTFDKVIRYAKVVIGS